MLVCAHAANVGAAIMSSAQSIALTLCQMINYSVACTICWQAETRGLVLLQEPSKILQLVLQPPFSSAILQPR